MEVLIGVPLVLIILIVGKIYRSKHGIVNNQKNNPEEITKLKNRIAYLEGVIKDKNYIINNVGNTNSSLEKMESLLTIIKSSFLMYEASKGELSAKKTIETIKMGMVSINSERFNNQGMDSTISSLTSEYLSLLRRYGIDPRN